MCSSKCGGEESGGGGELGGAGVWVFIMDTANCSVSFLFLFLV